MKCGFGEFDFAFSGCLVAEKVGENRGDWKILVVVGSFSDLVSRRKSKSLLD